MLRTELGTNQGTGHWAKRIYQKGPTTDLHSALFMPLLKAA